MPKGGARIGAGRPRNSERENWLAGQARKTGEAPLPPAPLPPVDVPEGLPDAERAIWLELAPHALAARTLTVATAGDFAALCRLEVEAAGVLEARRIEGWNRKGLEFAKEWRSLVQRLENKRRAFRLAPMGKPMETPVAAPEDPFGEFDSPTVN